MQDKYLEALNLMPAMPEVAMAVGAMALLMIGVFTSEKSTNTVTGLSIALLIVAGILVVNGGSETVEIFDGAFVVDPFSNLMKVLTLIGSIAAIAMSIGFVRREKFDRFEYPILIVLATLGMMMMISSNDLIALYLGLELQSLSLYVIAAINRDSTRSTEAGLKYFVLGALSSGFLLYGMSLIYGFTGHTGYGAIAAALQTDASSIGIVVGLVFVLAGLAFKISAVPFHMWTPDVYQGSPTPVTAFFAAAPKIAAMALFVRVVYDAFEPITKDWQQIVVFISIASMILGAFAAIGQNNIKRLMAYSSIGHMGYALVGLAAGSQVGVEGVIIYMLIYMVMTLGAFACILMMREKDGMVENIDALAGASKSHPWMAFVLAMIMFSLAGIPPLAGFFGKWFVFVAAIEADLYALAIIGVLASVVGAFYYLRIIKIMYFDEAKIEFVKAPAELRVIMTIAGLFVVGFMLIVGPVGEIATVAAKTFFAG